MKARKVRSLRRWQMGLAASDTGTESGEINMTNKLPKFTLDFDKKRENWRLTNDATDKVVKTFRTKEEVTKGGALEMAVGAGGGSVKVKTQDDKYQEERTYPRSADPKKSPG